jgi:hypothetical protein
MIAIDLIANATLAVTDGRLGDVCVIRNVFLAGAPGS